MENTTNFSDFARDEEDDEFSEEESCSTMSDVEPEMQDSEADIFTASESDEEDNDNRSETICNRTWKYIAPKSVECPQSVHQSGSLTNKSRNVKSIEECFKLFMDDSIIANIVTHTNQRANAHYATDFHSWKEVDSIEIYAVLGLLLLIGRFRESRESRNDLWRKDNVLSRQMYTVVMARDRFKDILRFIRFDNTETREDRKKVDKLAPIREVSDMFAANCRESYEASNTGTVDEQLVTYRGRCPFKVYMPSKPGKYGIKIWTLCDAKTYYCCNFDIYLGKIGQIPEKDQGQRVVKQLTDFWKNSNRVITTDNFFTSIILAEYLLDNGCFLVGTIRKNRKDLPKSIVGTYHREQYSSQFLFTNKLTLVSYVPKIRKCVVLLSSIHHEFSISNSENNFKPEIIKYYNSTKSGVDTLDKLLREYTCRRSTRRWPMSLFQNFIDIAAYNALVIWITKNPEWESKSSMKNKRKIFLEILAKELVTEYIERRAQRFENNATGLHKHIAQAFEAYGRPIRRKNQTPQTSSKRSRCHVCVGNDNKYSKKCEQCNNFICHNHTVPTKILCIDCSST
ncbi:piggyBac transposable element-derived protein 4-like [Onthophagus taurus]|uniref:piggyBac transposable element-derived protein 4-like n=1 Tax=Onthophagus taurus TaxID=166361 RepID=UPI000C1FFA67|nr:piggyBac transposable element-derived protein 3-like [Onthophagus taurus]